MTATKVYILYCIFPVLQGFLNDPCEKLKRVQAKDGNYNTSLVPNFYPSESRWYNKSGLLYLCHSTVPVSNMSLSIIIDGREVQGFEFERMYPGVSISRHPCGILLSLRFVDCRYSTHVYRCTVNTANGTALSQSARLIMPPAAMDRSPLVSSFGSAVARLHGNHTMYCRFEIHESDQVSEITMSFRKEPDGTWTPLRNISGKVNWSSIPRLTVLRLEDAAYVVNVTLYNVALEDNLTEYKCEVRGKCSNGSKILKLKVYDPTPSPLVLADSSPGLGVFSIAIPLSVIVIALVIVLSFVAWRSKFRSTPRSDVDLSLLNDSGSDLRVSCASGSEAGNRTGAAGCGLQPPNYDVPDGPSRDSADGIDLQTMGDSGLPSGPAADQYDAFICYSALDRDWVKDVLLRGLEARGFSCCIDYRDFVAGAYIGDNINNAIYGSRKTITVLSPNFINSAYCSQELATALRRRSRHQVIPIQIVNCDIPQFLRDTITYLDWGNPDVRPYFWEQLTRAMEP